LKIIDYFERTIDSMGADNEIRKQRIQNAYQNGANNVEKLPAREDFSPEQMAASEVRVAPYCRVSTLSEQQAESYELQKQYYKEYIEKHPNWVLVEIYADEGISATSVKHRKAFTQMIEDSKAGKIDLIVTKSVSRFARNVVDCVKYIRLLKALPKPVGVFFETENINSLTQNGELLLTVLAAFAQDESMTKSLSVAWGIRQRFDKGIPKIIEPYGYTRVKDIENGDTLVVNPKEAEVVKRIFRMYLQGMTPYKIAKTLTEEGIPSPKGKPKWTVSSVTYILGNDRYAGDVVMQKTYCVDIFNHIRVHNYGQVQQYRLADRHEAIIPKEEWKTAKEYISLPDRKVVIAEEPAGTGFLANFHPLIIKEEY